MCYIPNVIPPVERKNAVEFANTYIQTFHKHIKNPLVNISLILCESFSVAV